MTSIGGLSRLFASKKDRQLRSLTQQGFRPEEILKKVQDQTEMASALTRALRNGLDLGLLATDPAWDSLLRQERTGSALLRFVRTYGSDALVTDLERRIGTPR